MQPVFIFRRADAKFVVKTVKSYDWKYYDARWMDDPDLGTHADRCLVPDIDIKDQTFIFDDEGAAMRKVAELYVVQYMMDL